MITRVSQIDIDRLIAAADPMIKSAGNKLSSALKSIVENHDRYLVGVSKARETIGGLFSDAMLAAHLSARLQVMMRAARHRQKNLRQFSPYDSAIDFVVRRAQLPEDKLDYLRNRYGNAGLQIMSSEVDTEVERVAKEATAEIIKQGMHVREARQYLNEQLGKAGLSGVNPHLLNSLVRTQIQIAYSAGQWNALQDPVIQNELWGFEYITARDDRVRPEHEALDGTKLTKNDPFWQTYWPPNGYNCVPSDTLITTTMGQIPIINIKVGDLVLTHKGRWRPVIELHINKAPDELISLELDNGQSLRLTANHRVLTKRGWIEAALLNCGDKIVTSADKMIGNINNISQPQNIANEFMSFQRCLASDFSDFKTANQSWDIKIQPESAGKLEILPGNTNEIIKIKRQIKISKYFSKLFFLISHFYFCIRMTHWVNLKLSFFGLTHLFSDFWSFCRSIYFKFIRSFFGSFWVQPIMNFSCLRPISNFDFSFVKNSVDGPIFDTGFFKQIFQGHGSSDVFCNKIINTAKPEFVNNSFGSQSICSTPVGLFSFHCISPSKSNIPVLCIATIVNVKKEKCKENFVYNLGVADDKSYFANGIAAHNCRCIAIEIWNDESEKMRTIKRPFGVIEIDPEWRFNPGYVFSEAA